MQIPQPIETKLIKIDTLFMTKMAQKNLPYISGGSREGAWGAPGLPLILGKTKKNRSRKKSRQDKQENITSWKITTIFKDKKAIGKLSREPRVLLLTCDRVVQSLSKPRIRKNFDFSFVLSRWSFLFLLFVLQFWAWVISHNTKRKKWRTVLYRKYWYFS